MVNVAILGFGVVGSGVAEVLTGNGAGISKKADELISLKYVLDVRDFPDSPLPLALSRISLSLSRILRSMWWWRPLAVWALPWILQNGH